MESENETVLLHFSLVPRLARLIYKQELEEGQRQESARWRFSPLQTGLRAYSQT